MDCKRYIRFHFLGGLERFKGAKGRQVSALVTRAGVRSGLQTLGCLTAQEFDSSSGAIFFFDSHVMP